MLGQRFEDTHKQTNKQTTTQTHTLTSVKCWVRGLRTGAGGIPSDVTIICRFVGWLEESRVKPWGEQEVGYNILWWTANREELHTEWRGFLFTSVWMAALCTAGMSRRIFSTRVLVRSTACCNDEPTGTMGADWTKNFKTQQCSRAKTERKKSIITQYVKLFPFVTV